MVATLEPCAHTGRTRPVHRRPDRRRRRRGGGRRRRSRPAGRRPGHPAAARRRPRASTVHDDRAVAEQLAPYLHHRRTGRPFVVLKLAATLDGRTAAPDGSSAGGSPGPRPGPTPTASGPSATRSSSAPAPCAPTTPSSPSATPRAADPTPRRPGHRTARGPQVHPCLELGGDLGDVLDQLGGEGVLQLLVEGGPTVAGAFHRAGLVDRYVLYVAPGPARRRRRSAAARRPRRGHHADVWRGRSSASTAARRRPPPRLRPARPPPTPRSA